MSTTTILSALCLALLSNMESNSYRLREQSTRGLSTIAANYDIRFLLCGAERNCSPEVAARSRLILRTVYLEFDPIGKEFPSIDRFSNKVFATREHAEIREKREKIYQMYYNAWGALDETPDYGEIERSATVELLSQLMMSSEWNRKSVLKELKEASGDSDGQK